MELRKDPITRSWVITGDDVIEPTPRSEACRFCGSVRRAAQVIANLPGVDGSAWSARSVVHPHALYHIEGEPARRGDGLYDRMGSVGAHEVLIENPRHDGHLWNASDAEVEQFLRLAAQRIQDLKRDSRFKYISIFKNHGERAGQEFEHPTSQFTATTFVPRRVLYELRAGRDYFESKERCVFCDILAQEERQACASWKFAETIWPSAPMLRASRTKPGLFPAATSLPLSAPVIARRQRDRSRRAAAAHAATHPHRHGSLPPGASHLAQQPASIGNARILENAG